MARDAADEEAGDLQKIFGRGKVSEVFSYLILQAFAVVLEGSRLGFGGVNEAYGLRNCCRHVPLAGALKRGGASRGAAQGAVAPKPHHAEVLRRSVRPLANLIDSLEHRGRCAGRSRASRPRSF